MNSEPTFEPEEKPFKLGQCIASVFGLCYDLPPVEIFSQKSPTEILSHLNEKVESFWAKPFSIDGRYLGKVKDNSFVLMWFQPGKRNSWAPVLRGTIEPALSGSVIRAYFDVSRFTKIFSAIWILGLICIGVFMLLSPGESYYRIPSLVTIIPWGMVLFMLFLIKCGQYLGKTDCQKMIEMLERISV